MEERSKKDVNELEKRVVKLKILIALASFGIGWLLLRNRSLELNSAKRDGEIENLKDMLRGYQRRSERDAFSLGKLTRTRY